MNDILFKCEECGEILAINVKYKRQKFRCTACNQMVVVPLPEIGFVCPSCNNNIGAPASMEGADCTCPDCQQPITIPVQVVKQKLKLKSPYNNPDTPAVSSLYEGRTCPACNCEIPLRAVICTSCGHDFRTGKVSVANHGKKDERFKFLRLGMASALVTLLFLLGLHFGTIAKKTEVADSDVQATSSQALGSTNQSETVQLTAQSNAGETTDPLQNVVEEVTSPAGMPQVVIIEETQVDGIISGMESGMVFRTVSGATYEVFSEKKKTRSTMNARVAPKVTILQDDVVTKVMFEDDDQMMSCRQVIPPRITQLSKEDLEWKEAERGTLISKNKYGTSLKSGSIIILSTGGKYEILALADHGNYINKADQNVVVVSTNAYLCKITIGDSLRCLGKRVSADSPASVTDKSAVGSATPTEKSVAVIEAGKLQGTGFILILGSKKYLITNEHLVRGGSPIRARLLSGESLRFNKFEVCSDRDLVRMELSDQSLETLVPTSVMPAESQSIVTYGNQRGLGVLNRYNGRIRALGPDRLEIDIPLLPGMSGGPILAEDKVVGVSSFTVELFDHKKYMSSSGDVFQSLNSVGNKYFGVRIPEVDNTVWKLIAWSEYDKNTQALRDLWQCAEHLRDKVYVYLREQNYIKKVDFASSENSKYTVFYLLPQKIRSTVDVLNSVQSAITFRPKSIFKPITLRDTRLEKNRDRDNSYEESQRARAFAIEALGKKQDELNEKLKYVLKNAETSMAGNRWPTPGMKTEAEMALNIIRLLVDNMPKLEYY